MTTRFIFCRGQWYECIRKLPYPLPHETFIGHFLSHHLLFPIFSAYKYVTFTFITVMNISTVRPGCFLLWNACPLVIFVTGISCMGSNNITSTSQSIPVISTSASRYYIYWALNWCKFLSVVSLFHWSLLAADERAFINVLYSSQNKNSIMFTFTRYKVICMEFKY